MKSKRLVAAALAGFVLVALGLLMVVEILFRAFGPDPPPARLVDITYFTYHQYLASVHPPHWVIRQDYSTNPQLRPECVREDGVLQAFNSMGFRSPEFRDLPPKEANEVRIVITGGSASVSWGVAENCTLDRLLEKELQARFPEKRFRVFNLGNGTWKSLQELIAIELYGVDIKPDLVIDFTGFNDIQHAYDMPINRAYVAGMMELAFARYKDGLRGTVGDFVNNLRSVRYVNDLLTPQPVNLGNPHGPPEAQPVLARAPEPGRLQTRLETLPVDLDALRLRTDFDPLNQQVVDNFLKNLRMMAHVLETVEARLVVVLQPILYLKDPLSKKETEILWTHYYHSVNFVGQGYARMIDGLSELSQKERNVLFLDASRAFQGVRHGSGPEGTFIFTDYAHMTPTGYQLLAGRIAEFIAPHISLATALKQRVDERRDGRALRKNHEKTEQEQK